MAVILKIDLGGGRAHYVQGADGPNVNFTEDGSNALIFVDGAAATTFASGKQIFGAQQVTVTGLKNKATKSIT